MTPTFMRLPLINAEGTKLVRLTVDYRLDTPDARDFLGRFVTLP
jgi:hypothetical protein